MKTQLKLKPFHESVVDAINCAGVADLHVLAELIKRTKIPKNHDAIALEWADQHKKHRINIEYGVVESVLAQKRVVEEEAAKKDKTAAASVGLTT